MILLLPLVVVESFKCHHNQVSKTCELAEYESIASFDASTYGCCVDSSTLSMRCVSDRGQCEAGGMLYVGGVRTVVSVTSTTSLYDRHVSVHSSTTTAEPQKYVTIMLDQREFRSQSKHHYFLILIMKLTWHLFQSLNDKAITITITICR